ncbi:UNVERIFIED_CONTAM: YlzJ-like protein [Acetivibrio alkalicellulosi]
MILHSIVPVEAVFFNSEEEKKLMEIEYMGEKVMVVPLSNNRYIIDRVISTSLKSYLNPKLTPGSIIEA